MAKDTWCEYCETEFHPGSLTRHKRNQHPEELDLECPTCGKLFVYPSGMKNHHARVHGESIARIMVECERCGTEFESWAYRDEKFCTEECYYEYRDGSIIAGEKNPCYGLYGSDHPGWQGGSSYDKGVLNGRRWTVLREEVLERDNWECQECGDGEKPHVHHIIPRRFFYYHPFFTVDDDANVKENLVSLCSKHHFQAEHGVIDYSYEIPNSDFSFQWGELE